MTKAGREKALKRIDRALELEGGATNRLKQARLFLQSSKPRIEDQEVRGFSLAGFTCEILARVCAEATKPREVEWIGYALSAIAVGR